MSRLDQEVTWSRGAGRQRVHARPAGPEQHEAQRLRQCSGADPVAVGPVRDFFLQASNYADVSSPLVQRFGEVLRKMWNPRNFKGQVRAGSVITVPAPSPLADRFGLRIKSCRPSPLRLVRGRLCRVLGVLAVSPHEFMQA